MKRFRVLEIESGCFVVQQKFLWSWLSADGENSGLGHFDCLDHALAACKSMAAKEEFVQKVYYP